MPTKVRKDKRYVCTGNRIYTYTCQGEKDLLSFALFLILYFSLTTLWDHHHPYYMKEDCK